MFLRFRRLVVFALLCGCGDVSELIQYADSASEAQDLNRRVAALANTAFVSMPDAGSVSYTGNATVVYVQNGVEVGLLGQANVTADFGTGLVAGSADGFFGGTGPSDLQSYTGALTFAGQIGVRRPNSFDAVISGDLSGQGQTIAIDGPLMGNFRGPGAQAMSAVTNAQMASTINGIDVPVRIRVTATQ